jgi:hypothetical protein
MIWRWIIRGLCLALLTLCVTAWAGSYFECASISYGSKAGYLTVLDLIGGEVSFAHRQMPFPRGWTMEHGHGQYSRDQRDRAQAVNEIIPHHALGFAWEYTNRFFFSLTVITPLWFPPLLSALLLGLVWRKTRRKHATGGFPVGAGGAVGKEVKGP